MTWRALSISPYVKDFRSDNEVGIIGLREGRTTNYPFNAGINFFRQDRAAVIRVVRDVNERIDFFSGVAEESFRLDEIGLDASKCSTETNRKVGTASLHCHADRLPRVKANFSDCLAFHRLPVLLAEE